MNMKKVIFGVMAVLAVMNGVALYETQQLKAEVIHQQQLIDAQEKYIKAEIYRINAAFYIIASPAFEDKAIREKLQSEMKEACEKYKAVK